MKVITEFQLTEVKVSTQAERLKNNLLADRMLIACCGSILSLVSIFVIFLYLGKSLIMSLEQRQIKFIPRTKLNQSQLHQDLAWYSQEMLGHISFRSNLLTTICVSLRTKHFIQVFFLVYVECSMLT